MNSKDVRCVNAIRVFGAEIITKAKSGHPGIVLGSAPIVHTLFTRHMNINAEDEKWLNRDRFILSAGHGSALLYTMLHLCGYGVTIDDLKNLRQKGSLTPGHPEFGHTPGVEMTTGPLGQGISTAVGFAIAENYLGSRFNRQELSIVDHYTYVLCGDGDLQEGVSMEAASLAGHLGLNKLIVLYDSNDIQLDGEVSLANTENTKAKFEAMGWEHILVEDGNDCDEIDQAIIKAKESSKPSIIEIKTIIGYGAPNSGESSIHGKPMPKEDINALKNFLEYDEPEFTFPIDVLEFYKENVIDRGRNSCELWNSNVRQYAMKYSEEYEEFSHFLFEDFEIDSFDNMPSYPNGSKESTRKVMGNVIDWLSTKLPNIMGGSADLTASTMVKGADGIYGTANPIGRNIKFGVREHAMGAIVNGISLHGGLRGFCAAFFVFSDYMKPAIRLASIMKLPSVFLFSHDSVCVGEDGPTHQPIEQLAMFRSMPNTNVVRPADAREMTQAVIDAFKNNTYPTIITSSRQAVPNLSYTNTKGFAKGGYVAYTADKDAKYAMISCGTELSVCIEAAKKLGEEGIMCNVVSMPSMFLFDKQTEKYKSSVLPEGQQRLAVEMGATMPWYKYAKEVYGIDEFGASMPINDIIDFYGFTPDNIVKVFKEKFLG